MPCFAEQPTVTAERYQFDARWRPEYKCTQNAKHGEYILPSQLPTEFACMLSGPMMTDCSLFTKRQLTQHSLSTHLLCNQVSSVLAHHYSSAMLCQLVLQYSLVAVLLKARGFATLIASDSMRATLISVLNTTDTKGLACRYCRGRSNMLLHADLAADNTSSPAPSRLHNIPLPEPLPQVPAAQLARLSVPQSSAGSEVPARKANHSHICYVLSMLCLTL